MPVSFDQLRVCQSPSAVARRSLWHLLSVGTVWRDEPERHQGADKAGLHLFWVRRGQGWLETPQARSQLAAGPRCWLVDLRLPRSYQPENKARLVTDGFRFNGPMPDAWLDLVGGAGEFALTSSQLVHLKALRRTLNGIASGPAPASEWRIHTLVTEAWGVLMEARNRLPGSTPAVRPSVQRVVDAVLQKPDHAWQAGEMAAIAGTSYSALRAAFKVERGETLHDFLQQVRLDQARAWLADVRLSIKEVSARLHFRGETYFTHWFRARSGQTPSACRRALRG